VVPLDISNVRQKRAIPPQLVLRSHGVEALAVFQRDHEDNVVGPELLARVAASEGGLRGEHHVADAFLGGVVESEEHGQRLLTIEVLCVQLNTLNVGPVSLQRQQVPEPLKISVLQLAPESLRVEVQTVELEHHLRGQSTAVPHDGSAGVQELLPDVRRNPSTALRSGSFPNAGKYLIQLLLPVLRKQLLPHPRHKLTPILRGPLLNQLHCSLRRLLNGPRVAQQRS